MVDIIITVPQEDYDCVQEQFHKVGKIKRGQQANADGNLLYLDINENVTTEEETRGLANSPLMGMIPDLDENGVQIMIYNTTFDEWTDNAVKNKVRECKKRADPLGVSEEENRILRLENAELKGRE